VGPEPKRLRPSKIFVAAQFFLAFLFYLALAVIKTLPLVGFLGSRIPMDPGDPLLNTWILSWGAHALAASPLRLFDANIFYPAQNTLALSEHLLGVQPIFTVAYLLTGNPVAGYNVLFLLSFALSGVSAFALAYYFTREFWSSLVAGSLFGFAAFRFGQLSHVQLLSFYWAPVAIVFLDLFIRRRQWQNLVAFAILFWLQVLSSVYLGYMMMLAVALYAGYHALVADRSLLSGSMALKTAAFLAASAVVLGPVHLPYLEAHRGWGFERSLAELKLFNPDLASYLSAPPFMNDLYLAAFRFLDVPAAGEKWLFPGLVLPALAVLGSRGHIEGMPQAAVSPLRHAFWLLLGAAWLLSLGPRLLAFGFDTRIPLPYLLLYHLVPGFGSMRVPGRFALLVVLAAIPLAALGVIRSCAVARRWCGSYGRSRAVGPLVSAGLIGLFLLELGWKPLPLVQVPVGAAVPPVYRWLAVERPGPIVELPYGPDMNPAWKRENYGLLNDDHYIYLSAFHWLPLANGVSGFTPPIYDEIRLALRQLPARRAVEYAGSLGIKAVVVHTDKLPAEERERWGKETEPGGLRQLATFGADVVYAVPEVLTVSSPAVELASPRWAPADRRVRLALLVRGRDGRPWVHPGPHGLSAVIARWRDSRGTPPVEYTTRVLLPVAVPRDEVGTVPLDIPPPGGPGTYSLEVSIPSVGARAVLDAIELRRPGALTLDRPAGLLKSSYEYRGSAEVAVSAEERLEVDVTAVNTGDAVWLATAKKNRGLVMLGWRWYKEGRELTDLAARSVLQRDVSPGQAYRFQVSVDTPSRPGHYLLELGLVSEHVAWFSDAGSPPVSVSVEVRPAPEEAFRALLRSLRLWGGHAPRLDLSVARSGPVCRISVAPTSVKPQSVDSYVRVQGPNGVFWLSDDGRLVLRARGWWLPLALGAPVPTSIAVPVSELPPGKYVYHLLLTEPDSYRIIADAEGSFEATPGRC